MLRRWRTSAFTCDVVSVPPGTDRPSCASRTCRSVRTSLIHSMKGVGSSGEVEGLAVVGEAPVAVTDLGLEVGLTDLVVGIGLCCAGKDFAGVINVLFVEQACEPAVEAGHDGVFLDVDALGVSGRIDAVVIGELAAVVGPAVVHWPCMRRPHAPQRMIPASR